MDWTTKESCFDSRLGQEFFSSCKCPSWLWGTPNLLFSMYSTKDHVSRGESAWEPIPLAAQSKAWVYSCSLPEIVGSGAWMSVCCECCVLSGRGLCDGPIAPPEESYLYGVSECDLKTSTMRRSRPTRVVEPLKKKSGWVMKLISCVCLVLKLRMSGAIVPFPHAFIVCKEVNTLPFYFLVLTHLCVFFFSGQEFWEQQKQLEEQRERREKEKLEALKKKDKHEHSAVASHEVKRKLMVSLYHVSIPE